MSFLFRCLTFRAGMFPELSKQWVPGSPNSKKGDEVYARPDAASNGKGTYAEYVVAKETEAALKPKSVDHVHAAAIPVVALTAWLAIFAKFGLIKSQSILIKVEV